MADNDANAPRAGGANDAAIAAAIAQLAAAVQQFNDNTAAAANRGHPVHAVAQPLLDPFASTTPFDRSTRAGSTAYAKACEALPEPWDGTPNTLPSFVMSLRVHSHEANWNAAAPQGILTYGNHHLLTSYHAISEATLVAAHANRVDPRAIQNSKAMYECLKRSVTGDLRSTLFDQASNLMTTMDGPLFFKKMLSFTTVATLQLSMFSLNEILRFDPADYNFVIPTVNTKLLNLFVLATTSTRNLDDNERIQHTLTAYQRIRQPEIWAQWVRNKADDFETGSITVCQDFMNTAVLKYNKICAENNGTFPGSASTIQQDIVAMVAANNKRKKTSPKSDSKPKSDDSSDSQGSNSKKTKQFPSWVKHYKSSSADDATLYKLGDTKTWKNETWHFCDCLNHRDNHKWHPHPPADCRTRKKWLVNNKPSANNALETEDDDPANDPAEEPAAGELDDLSAMLANALTLSQDNPAASEAIATALNAIAHG